jgi:hypothetical protein
MDHAEQIAKATIESLIPGAAMCYHANQSSGTHDFDLEQPNAPVAA